MTACCAAVAIASRPATTSLMLSAAASPPAMPVAAPRTPASRPLPVSDQNTTSGGNP